MKEVIRCYHTFLPRTWMKSVLYLLCPCFVSGCSLFGFLLFRRRFYVIFFFLVAGMVGMEILMDSCCFHSIGIKQGDYIKTSTKGLDFLKKALSFDGIRRILTFIVSLSLPCWLFVQVDQKSIEKEIISQFGYLLFVLFVMEVAIALLRLLSNFVLNIAVLYTACALTGIGGYILQIPVPAWLLAVGSFVYIVVAWYGRKKILKRVRDSYYDEKMDK